MKLKTAIFSIAMVAASIANAQSNANSVRAQLRNLGYSNIQVERNGNSYTVEALRNGKKREIVYDGPTGEIQSDHTYGDSSNDYSNDGSNDHSSDGGNDNSSDGGNDNSSDGGNDNSSDGGDDHSD